MQMGKEKKCINRKCFSLARKEKGMSSSVRDKIGPVDIRLKNSALWNKWIWRYENE